MGGQVRGLSDTHCALVFSSEPNLEEAYYLDELAEEASWLTEIRATTLG